MSFAPVLVLVLLATLLVDLLLAAWHFARSEVFWPSAFCVSLAGLSAAFMWLAFADFEATPADVHHAGPARRRCGRQPRPGDPQHGVRGQRTSIASTRSG